MPTDSDIEFDPPIHIFSVLLPYALPSLYLHVHSLMILMLILTMTLTLNITDIYIRTACKPDSDPQLTLTVSLS